MIIKILRFILQIKILCLIIVGFTDDGGGLIIFGIINNFLWTLDFSITIFI